MALKTLTLTIAASGTNSTSQELPVGTARMLVCPVCDAGNITIQVSTDNSTWIPVGTGTGVPAPSIAVGVAAIAVPVTTVFPANVFVRLVSSVTQTSQRVFSLLLDY